MYYELYDFLMESRNFLFDASFRDFSLRRHPLKPHRPPPPISSCNETEIYLHVEKWVGDI